MSICEVKDKKTIEHLFQGWQETLIWSCLQDCMGNAFADNLTEPKSAQIVIADFCFFAGAPNRELVQFKPECYHSDFIIMIPQNEDWADLIEKIYGTSAVMRNRYAIKKEPDVFKKEKLEQFVEQIPETYEIKMIDEEIYDQIKTWDWAADLCSQFRDYEDYKKRGLGAAVLKDGVIVSGASSYTVYRGGIEIEIDTKEEVRRRGLALACGAKLILECLKRSLYPSWDAQNKGSLALAQKLGYHFDKEYPAYEITGYSL